MTESGKSCAWKETRSRVNVSEAPALAQTFAHEYPTHHQGQCPFLSFQQISDRG